MILQSRDIYMIYLNIFHVNIINVVALPDL
jgi:hypothetical protein